MLTHLPQKLYDLMNHSMSMLSHLTNKRIGILSWAMLGVILSIFLFRVISHISYTPDDTYIYMQFARNVVWHHEMSFNAGEPTYGVTSPLWLGAVSVVGWMGVDLLIGAKVLDILLSLGAIVAIFVIQRSWSESRLVAVLTAAVFSTHIWFLRWAGTGMETSLAALLGLLTIHFLVIRRYNAAATFSALLILTRPESLILMVVALACSLYLNRRGEVVASTLLRFSIIDLGICLPWLVYALLTLHSEGLSQDIRCFRWNLLDYFGRSSHIILLDARACIHSGIY